MGRTPALRLVDPVSATGSLARSRRSPRHGQSRTKSDEPRTKRVHCQSGELAARPSSSGRSHRHSRTVPFLLTPRGPPRPVPYLMRPFLASRALKLALHRVTALTRHRYSWRARPSSSRLLRFLPTDLASLRHRARSSAHSPRARLSSRLLSPPFTRVRHHPGQTRPSSFQTPTSSQPSRLRPRGPWARPSHSAKRTRTSASPSYREKSSSRCFARCWSFARKTGVARSGKENGLARSLVSAGATAAQRVGGRS